MPDPGRPPLLVVEGLRKQYAPQRAWTGRRRTQAHVAVADASFALERHKTIGLIGESGSGKSTIARCVLGLTRATSGSIRFDGVELTDAGAARLRAARRQMQIVFQNPDASLDPRWSIGASVAEPLAAYRVGTRESRRARVRDLLEYVGLDPSAARYPPHEFSGGERQRIAIARALALEPALIVCDEVASALDVSVQAQILNLLRDLQEQLDISYLFISHDIAVVRAMSDDIIVLKDGTIVERGSAEQVCGSPSDAYTRRLIEAAAISDHTGASKATNEVNQA